MKVLITGAASGIGRSLARELAHSVQTLILVDLNQPGLDELANELKLTGVTTKCFAGNLTDAPFLDELCAYLKVADIDVLINNAGVAHELKEFSQISDCDCAI